MIYWEKKAYEFKEQGKGEFNENMKEFILVGENFTADSVKKIIEITIMFNKKFGGL